MAAIKDFLPIETKEKEVPLQVEMPKSLKKQLQDKLKKEGVTLKDFFVASAKAYLSEK